MSLEKLHLNIDSGLAEKDLSGEERGLSNFCRQFNNPIVFLKTGSKNESEAELADNLEMMDEEEKVIAEMILLQADTFLHSPAFTDSFHEDHAARREWERDSLNKDSFSEVAKLYASNRFNLNLLGLPMLFLSWAESLEEKYFLSSEQKKIIDKIKIDLDAIGKDKFNEYASMNDEQKFELITQLEVVFQNIVALLSGK